MLNKSQLLFISLCIICFSPLAFASKPLIDIVPNENHVFVTLTGGGIFSGNVAGSKNFPATEALLSYYNYNNTGGDFSQALFGASLGLEHAFNSKWLMQAAISYYQPGLFMAEGEVTQGVDVASQNSYSYQYKISSYQALLESKLLYHCGNFYPYLSVGLGAAFNHTQDFFVDIEPAFTTFSNVFSSYSNTAFSYSVGTGVDWALFKWMRFGFGYRFVDFGIAKTGKSMIDDVATDYQLSTKHLYGNEVVSQLTFLVT